MGLEDYTNGEIITERTLATKPSVKAGGIYTPKEFREEISSYTSPNVKVLYTAETPREGQTYRCQVTVRGVLSDGRDFEVNIKRVDPILVGHRDRACHYAIRTQKGAEVTFMDQCKIVYVNRQSPHPSYGQDVRFVPGDTDLETHRMMQYVHDARAAIDAYINQHAPGLLALANTTIKTEETYENLDEII